MNLGLFLRTFGTMPVVLKIKIEASSGDCLREILCAWIEIFWKSLWICVLKIFMKREKVEIEWTLMRTIIERTKSMGSIRSTARRKIKGIEFEKFLNREALEA